MLWRYAAAVPPHARVLALASAAIGAILLGIGVVYLTVACESLPGVLGPSAGDSSPRTTLGIIWSVLGIAALAVAVVAVRRRPPSADS
jgi:hypothetical protein